MKLSEAIRAGAKLRPQCFDEFFYEGGSCALGAALEAVGYGYGDKTRCLYSTVSLEFPIVAKTIDGRPVREIITDMNDLQQLTREEIADWVEKELGE